MFMLSRVYVAQHYQLILFEMYVKSRACPIWLQVWAGYILHPWLEFLERNMQK